MQNGQTNRVPCALGVLSTITAQPDLQIRYNTCSGGAAGCRVNNGRTSPRRPGFAPERAAEIARARTADLTDLTERTTDADLRALLGRRVVRRAALDAAIVNFLRIPAALCQVTSFGVRQSSDWRACCDASSHQASGIPTAFADDYPLRGLHHHRAGDPQDS